MDDVYDDPLSFIAGLHYPAPSTVGGGGDDVEATTATVPPPPPVDAVPQTTGDGSPADPAAEVSLHVLHESTLRKISSIISNSRSILHWLRCRTPNFGCGQPLMKNCEWLLLLILRRVAVRYSHCIVVFVLRTPFMPRPGDIEWERQSVKKCTFIDTAAAQPLHLIICY